MLQAKTPIGDIQTRDDLAAVAGAIHIMRAGAFVELAGEGSARALIPAELALHDDVLMRRCRMSGSLIKAPGLELSSIFERWLGSGFQQKLPDPDSRNTPDHQAAVNLLKMAGFLPVGIAMPVGDLPAAPLIRVKASAILDYPNAAARELEIASSADVPLKEAAKAAFVIFRSRLGGPLHQAVVIGDPMQQDAPLCRIHSECFTGDIFASMRCDCGEQLHGAIQRMASQGGGVLLYLSQEGRGIGLVNKLRAYQLQSGGADTVDANTLLGFEPDERNFACAARMLELLDIQRVQLMTNNPAKIQSLVSRGIEVTGRIEHIFEANEYNQFYLSTKAKRSGHLL